MKEFYKYIGVIITLRHLYKLYLLFKLNTDTHIGYEYQNDLYKYKNFNP